MAYAEQTAGRTAAVDFEPVTRVAGGLALHLNVDLDRGAVLDGVAEATHFRGYEVILEDRDPRDAVFVSSRACGVCGGAHATASAMACEMTFGVQPPPTAIATRNLLAATEHLVDLPSALFLRAGPDFCEPVVRATNPELWTRAAAAPAPRAAVHGLARIADIMTAMAPFTGALHREALAMARWAREAYVLLGGKYPHPETMIPGGMSATVDPSDLNVAMLRIVRFFDYSRRVVAVWDDLAEFLLEAEPRFGEVGAGPMNFLDLGLWDDPEAYDATYENASAWGERRWATPGVVIRGELRTTALDAIDAGLEEFVEHAFYEDWTHGGTPLLRATPGGHRVSAHHPWNKKTLPRPASADAQRAYSWSTAPRWDRQPMETGAGARLWITALADRTPHRRFVEPTGTSLRLSVPQGEMPAAVLEWRIPNAWNALERHRARAYSLVHSALVAYENLLLAYDLRRREGLAPDVSRPFAIPSEHAIGVGFWGSANGALSHHMEIDGRVIRNYQIVGPSTWTASPRDAFGTPGPYEQAVLATPLLSTAQPERCIDALRAIRSFDPCMNCTTH
jgi:hydrogenase large subunit